MDRMPDSLKLLDEHAVKVIVENENGLMLNEKGL